MKLQQWIPASTAHTLAPYALKVVSRLGAVPQPHYDSFEWRGMTFRNRLGIAGGVDKNALNILDWQRLGAGFLEVGTVTPLPQQQNPGKVIDRSWDDQWLWNQLGFPNHGAQVVATRIHQQLAKLSIPLFLNIGKNRTTLNEQAHIDYQNAALILKDLTSVFVINISSPNTTGLRDLQSAQQIQRIFDSVRTVAPNHHLLLKLSPDLTDTSLLEVIDASGAEGCAGWVLTNTTLTRPANSRLPLTGGLSGEFLRKRSVEILNLVVKHLGPNKGDHLVISAGGVINANDIRQRRDCGADLVQTYSGLVFQGPSFFSNSLNQLRSASNNS